MEERYLSWLLALPGVTVRLAKSLAERYTDFEQLRSARKYELGAIPGITSELASRILEAVRNENSSEPAIRRCPTCGATNGLGTRECRLCGQTLGAPMDGQRSTPLENLLRARDGAAKICIACGAYLNPEVAVCPVCEARYSAEELTNLPAVDTRPLQETENTLCAHCGAYLLDDAVGCVICGRDVTRAARTLDARDGKGLGRDFLSRWQRVALEDRLGPDTLDKLEEELRHVDRLLEADSRLERAWLRKGRLLVELRRAREAIECFDRAGQLNPERDAEYGREALEALGGALDLTALPARWASRPDVTPSPRPPPPSDEASRVRRPPDSAPEKVSLPETARRGRGPLESTRPTQRMSPRHPSVLPDEVATREMVANLDRLLGTDQSQRVVWEMKGELLKSLGRSIEAEECFERAKALAGAEWDLTRGAGLQTHPPHGWRGRSISRGGRTNGRTNGLTNGRVNGLTNGRVNGLTNGRVNGLTNGRVNGLTNGRRSEAGRVNGILLPGVGRTNGLVNGDGFTNGRLGGFGSPRPRGLARIRSTVGIASVVLALVLAPIVLSMLTMPAAPGGIVIDGSFADWDHVSLRFDDRTSDQTRNSDVNLVAYKLAADDYRLSVYARVAGIAFRGAGNASDLLVALIDTDRRADTGYDLGMFGADYAVEVYGWDGGIHGALPLRFESANRRDWHGFRQFGAATAAASGPEVEFTLEIDNPTAAQVLLVVMDGQGVRDAADAVVRSGTGAAAVRETALAPAVLGSPAEAGILRLDVWPAGPTVAISGVSVTKRGSAPDSAATLRLYRDNGDGLLGPGDVRLGTSGLVQGRAEFLTPLTVASLITLFVSAEFATLPANSTFGLAFDGFDTSATTTIESRDPFLSYLAQAPQPVVDGAFGDWSTVPRSSDPIGDVVNQSGPTTLINANIDLVETASHTAGNVSFYLRVDGTILGGVDVPNLRARIPAPGESDSDLDTVPDNVEFALGNPALRYDFDNDNITDGNEFRDVDSDGIVDHPTGPDLWLNTTIPPWYPPPFASRVVSRYIGPIAPPVFEGVDSAIVYVDGDNATDTGLPTTIGTLRYGLDWAIVVAGRHGTVVASDLFRIRPGATVPWERVAAIPAAVDAHRLEASVPSLLLNLSSNYRTVYYATDWTLSFDIGLPVPPARSFPPIAGTRSPAGDNVVINEISTQPNPEWIELANPTSNPISLLAWRLQRRQGSSWTTIFMFTSQVIGAWGSGSEYLVVSPPFNSLPNGQSTVRLVNPFGTVIDLTTYPRTGQGRTWSRLKHPSTGMPVDSDNDVADFYISLFPSRGRPNDRHRPAIAVAMTADRSTGAPGDLISFSVYYNNTNTGYANHVWVNDTLPSQVNFVSSSVSPTGNTGQTYSWHFGNVAPLTNNVLTVTVRVNNGTMDGALLVNRVDIEYTDQLNRRLAGSSAWRNATVSRPVISVEKVASPSTAQPGDTIVYTIFFNNTGSASASHVWINDTLSADVTFVTSSVPPTSRSGQTYMWHFTNVAPGPHSFTVTVVVNLNATSPDLVNWVYLNYTTQNNYPLEESQASFTVPIPEFSTLALVAAVPLALCAIRRWRGCAPRKKSTVADSVPGIGGR